MSLSKFGLLVILVSSSAMCGCSDHRDIFGAIERGDDIRVAALLDSGVDPNARDSLDAPLLFVAARAGHAETVRLLLARGADPDASWLGITSLLMTAFSPDCDGQVIEALLQAGASPHATSPELPDTTPLLAAAPYGRPECLEPLVAAGADVKAVDGIGDGVVYHSVLAGNLDVVRYFLELGAPADTRNAQGGSPLMLAAFTGQSAIVALLLDYGADPCASDGRNRTVAEIAEDIGIKALISERCDRWGTTGPP